jgi:hypothetical protein
VSKAEEKVNKEINDHTIEMNKLKGENLVDIENQNKRYINSDPNENLVSLMEVDRQATSSRDISKD